MKIPCSMCGKPIKVPFLAWLLRPPMVCKNEMACLNRIKAGSNPPDPEFDDDNPPPIDRWVCPSCGGHGEVIIRRDWETGAYETQECAGGCIGTGRFEAVVESREVVACLAR